MPLVFTCFTAAFLIEFNYILLVEGYPILETRGLVVDIALFYPILSTII